eukprot:gene8701-biopygen12156
MHLSNVHVCPLWVAQDANTTATVACAASVHRPAEGLIKQPAAAGRSPRRTGTHRPSRATRAMQMNDARTRWAGTLPRQAKQFQKGDTHKSLIGATFQKS